MTESESRRTLFDRRAFLRTGLVTGGALLPHRLNFSEINSGGNATSLHVSRVVIGTDPELRNGKKSVSSGRLAKLLDNTIQALFDSDDPLQPWRKLASPGKVIGLKVNCLAGRGISTTPLLVELISERLLEAGVKSEHILIWDRLSADLERAGYSIRERGGEIRCFGNDYLGFESRLSVFGSVGSLLCKTLTQVCDVVINLPVLKNHGITGVTGALKNLFGAIHNPNKYHLNGGDPYIADVWMLPPVREKVRLTIVDGITGQYHGGPSYMPRWTWPFNGLIAGIDPVSLDQTVWKVLEEKRRSAGEKPLAEIGLEPRYIATAADPSRSLGTSNPQNIEVVKI